MVKLLFLFIIFDTKEAAQWKRKSSNTVHHLVLVDRYTEG